jgi:hypothetical protein
MGEIYDELERISEGGDVRDELLIILRVIGKIMAGLKGDEEDFD